MYVVLSEGGEFDPGDTPEQPGTAHTFGAYAAYDAPGLGKVLIVDDSRMSRSILRSILEKAGYSIIGEAANGEEAVEAYKEKKPDLVTLDITMPVMDGLHALTRILSFDAEAKVVMITAAGQQDKLIQALKEGAKRFINKPFNEDEILKNIRDILGGE